MAQDTGWYHNKGFRVDEWFDGDLQTTGWFDYELVNVDFPPHQLVIQDATHAHAADNVVLEALGGSFPLRPPAYHLMNR